MYLREPVNTFYRHRSRTRTVFHVNKDAPPKDYHRAAKRAFSGIPKFAKSVVRHPAQWRLFNRSHNRLVVKEVNPLAIDWYLRYRPRVIFIVRHPVAVALSYKKLGWWYESSDSTGLSAWKEHGQYFGQALYESLNRLTRYDDYRIVTYEDLCASPIDTFRGLFEFAELQWTPRVQELILQKSAATDSAGAFDTTRESAKMIDAWKASVSSCEVNSVKEGFQHFDLPWYRSESDWHLPT